MTTGITVTKHNDMATNMTGWQTSAGEVVLSVGVWERDIRLKHNLTTTKEVTKGKSWALQRPSFLPKKWEKGISFCLLVACDLNTLQLEQQIQLAKSKKIPKLLLVWWVVFVESKTERAMHCPGGAEQSRGRGKHYLISSVRAIVSS